MGVDQKDLFGQNISILSRMARTHFQRELINLGISPGQQAYLLTFSPGEVLKPEELSIRLQVDKANVARAVSALEIRGYLTRTTDEDDRRAWLVSLTTDGQTNSG